MSEKASESKTKKTGTKHNKELGRRGEDAAVRFLVRRGYDILDRNWTCSHGEVDIVAKNESALVFVEVKTRTGDNCGFPEEAVDQAKRRRYENIAIQYLRNYELEEDIPVRFDVVGILVIAPDRAMVRHHINAWGVA